MSYCSVLRSDRLYSSKMWRAENQLSLREMKLQQEELRWFKTFENHLKKFTFSTKSSYFPYNQWRIIKSWWTAIKRLKVNCIRNTYQYNIVLMRNFNLQVNLFNLFAHSFSWMMEVTNKKDTKTITNLKVFYFILPTIWLIVRKRSMATKSFF